MYSCRYLLAAVLRPSVAPTLRMICRGGARCALMNRSNNEPSILLASSLTLEQREALLDSTPATSLSIRRQTARKSAHPSAGFRSNTAMIGSRRSASPSRTSSWPSATPNTPARPSARPRARSDQLGDAGEDLANPSTSRSRSVAPNTITAAFEGILPPSNPDTRRPLSTGPKNHTEQGALRPCRASPGPEIGRC